MILDAGVPIKRMLPYLGDFRSVAGCLVTHEHNDHFRGAAELARRGVNVYCSAGTAKASGVDTVLTRLNVAKPLQQIKAGGFTILPFDTQHDAAEPLGYIVRHGSETAMYATDTYYLRYTFPGVNYWIVECNYCDEILEKSVQSGEIDAGLRGRLVSSHMSLRRLSDALMANDLRDTAKIVLVHLSDSRSDERKMVEEISRITGIDTVAASNGMSIDLFQTPF